MTNRPTSTKPHADQGERTGDIARSPTSGGTEPESELTRRARDVLAGLSGDATRMLRVAASPIELLYPSNEEQAELSDLLYAKVVRAVGTGARGGSTYRATDLGRECARLLSEGGA